MVDYIRFDVPLSFEGILLNNSRTHFQGLHDYKTGEVFDYPIVGTYENFEITIKKTKIFIAGSIHNYFNRKINDVDHNFNDFSYSEFIRAVSILSRELELPADRLKLENVEVGVNVKVSFNVTEMLKNTLIDWNGKAKYKNQSFKNGFETVFKTSEKYIKYYDKGRQYSLPYEKIRAEIKYMRNEVLFKKAGVITLQDLTIKRNFDRLINDFKKQISKVNIVDSRHINDQLHPKDQELFKNGIDGGFWSNYKECDYKIRFGIYRNKYLKLVERLGLNKQRKELTQSILTKTLQMCKNES